MPLQELDHGLSMPIIEVIVRATLSFWTILILTRIMGRKQLAQLTFFDYITGISIGSISAALAIDKAIPLITGILALIIWASWVMVVNFVNLKSVPARKYIDGEPIVVVHNGKILEKNLGSRYYNVDDFLMELRKNGIFDPNEVQIGVMEPDGNLSILKKSQCSQCPSRLDASMRKELIVDGKIIVENLATNQVDEQWLRQELIRQGVQDIQEVLLAMITPSGLLYIDRYQDRSEE